MRKPRLVSVTIAGAALALIGPHPNFVHVGYYPIGLTFLHLMECDLNSAIFLIGTYLAELGVCTFILYVLAMLALLFFKVNRKSNGDPTSSEGT